MCVRIDCNTLSHYSRDMETNFPKLVSEVLAAYDMSEAKLAKHINVSQPTIHRIKTGQVRDPGYSIGQAIIELHQARPHAAA